MKKERLRPPYKWFIEPRDGHTNEAIARLIPGEETREIHDENGIPRKVYLISSRMLTQFRNSKADAGFRFNVLGQEGEGKIRDVKFLPSTRKKKAAAFSRKAIAAATARK